MQLNSEQFEQDNPFISINTARSIIDMHGIDDTWITFAFTDHPEALQHGPGYATVDTAILLAWLGY